MLNNVILVGRVVDKPKLTKVGTDFYVCTLTLAVDRPYRDKQNEKVTDFIPVSVWNGISKFVDEYLEKGDVVGMKCRLKQKKQTIDGTNIYSIEVICERLVLIASKSNKKRDYSKPQVGNLDSDGLINDINNPDESFYESDDDFDDIIDEE